MANGKLGNALLAATTQTVVYTVPGAATLAATNVNICNQGTVDALVRIGISTGASPAASEYIEYDVIVPPNGVLERTGIFMSANEKLFVYSSVTNVSVRVHGMEEGV